MQGNVIPTPDRKLKCSQGVSQFLPLVQVEKSYQQTILIETPQVFESFEVLMSLIESAFGVVLYISSFHQIQFKKRAMGSNVSIFVCYAWDNIFIVRLCLSST